MDDYKMVAPISLKQVFSLLSEYGSEAALLAGGTDLVNHIRNGKLTPKLVVQLRKVNDLGNRVEEGKEGITIGAMTTLNEIARNPSLQKWFPAITEAADRVGSKQIRNRATLVGNVCNASPAADTVPALLLYDSLVSITSKSGDRIVPVEDFILGPNKNCLAADEIVKSIFIPYPVNISSSVYLKFSRRDGVDLAMVGVGVYTSVSGEVRIALGAVGPKAYRVHIAEEMLKQGLQKEDCMKQGLEIVVASANPITDLRATREYRLAMIKALTLEAIEVSLDRLRKSGGRK